MLKVGRKHEPCSWYVDAAHQPRDVRAIVGQPAASVGEIVGIATERGRLRRRDGAGLPACRRRTAGGQQPIRLRPVYDANACQPSDRRFSAANTAVVVVIVVELVKRKRVR